MGIHAAEPASLAQRPVIVLTQPLSQRNSENQIFISFSFMVIYFCMNFFKFYKGYLSEVLKGAKNFKKKTKLYLSARIALNDTYRARSEGITYLFIVSSIA